MTSPDQLNGKKLARIIDLRYEILETLYPDKEFTLTELHEKTRIDTGNLSKMVKGAKNIRGLLDLKLPNDEALIEAREMERERGRPFKYIRLTESGKRIVSSFVEALKPLPSPGQVRLSDPDQKYWENLRTKLSSRHEWVTKAALQDLTILCRNTRLWKLGDNFWHYLIEQFNTTENSNLGQIVDCINIIFRSASATEEKEAKEKISGLFSERLAELIGTDQHIYEWSIAFGCLRIMLPTAEMLKLIQEKYEKALKSEEKFGKISTLLIDELKKLYKTSANEIREWLYKQMENSDPKAAERAYSLYQALLESPSSDSNTIAGPKD
jgi:predicted transcriptional regulator with HTH domain